MLFTSVLDIHHQIATFAETKISQASQILPEALGTQDYQIDNLAQDRWADSTRRQTLAPKHKCMSAYSEKIPLTVKCQAAGSHNPMQ